jgi:F-type H+-transporting ATPase subunit a
VATDPIHQFQIHKLIPIDVGGVDFSFTNSSLFMVLTVVCASAFLVLSTRGRGLVPGRWQSAAEMTYEFIAQTLRDSAGSDGMRFFPFVFTLFMFVLVSNLWGMFPYFFTVTAHIIITAALALAVILLVVFYGLKRHKFGFFLLFVPKGVPGAILPFIVVIEVLSFLSRPLSLSIRLFANMLAGHITLKVFAGFVIGLASLGVVGVLGAILPLAATVALTALEFLVAALQAYVFAILTCLYLNDALHPSH